MPSVLHDVPVAPPPPMPPRKRWTREQVAAAEAIGIFAGENLELIHGELISKMGKNRRHVVVMAKVYAWLLRVFGEDYVNSEAPIDPATADRSINEPQPDLIVLNRDQSSLMLENPKPEDLRMILEISDSTLAFDLNVKSILYARAGIADYWVLDITGRRVIVHRDPSADGYRDVKSYAEHESVAPLEAPEQPFCWAKVMPSSEAV